MSIPSSPCRSTIDDGDSPAYLVPVGMSARTWKRVSELGSGPLGRLERRTAMRLTRRDAAATVFVGAAAALYGLWLAGVEVAGLSEVRVVTGIVLGLGFAASASAVVPTFETLWHGSKAYLALTSLIGLGALAAGVAALVTEREEMLTALVLATLALWIISTIRHAALAPRGSRPRAAARTSRAVPGTP